MRFPAGDKVSLVSCFLRALPCALGFLPAGGGQVPPSLAVGSHLGLADDHRGKLNLVQGIGKGGFS